MSQDQVSVILEAIADSTGFVLLNGEDENGVFWIHLERKPGTMSTEESESEVMVGYPGGRYEKFPLKKPTFVWKTKHQLLGFVAKTAAAILTRDKSLIIDLENLGKKNSL